MRRSQPNGITDPELGRVLMHAAYHNLQQNAVGAGTAYVDENALGRRCPCALCNPSVAEEEAKVARAMRAWPQPGDIDPRDQDLVSQDQPAVEPTPVAPAAPKLPFLEMQPAPADPTYASA